MPQELLSIQPSELKFPLELKKQISCSLRLVNATEHYVAFKVKTTSPKNYCVRPNSGVVLPHSSTDITVTMQSQREAPPDLQCKDKFLIQSVIAPPGFSAKDVSRELFNKELGKDVYETKLRAAYVPPPQPPSPVLESTEEGVSPKAFYSSDNEDRNVFFNDTNSKDISELRAMLTEVLTEAIAAFTTLNEEHDAALRKSQLLQQELAIATFTTLNEAQNVALRKSQLLQQELAIAAVTTLNEEHDAALRKSQLLQQELAEALASKSKAEAAQFQQRFPFVFVIIVAILSFLLGILLY